MINEKIFDESSKNIKIYTLKNDYLEVQVSNLGVTILKIMYPDGKDVVLGYDTLDEYIKFENYFGATIGRCANRIKDAKFKLNGKEYIVDCNDNGNSLHGGQNGFYSKIFDTKIEKDKIIFHYFSENLEEGYPGNLDFSVIMYLEGDCLHIEYDALSDEDTIINFTNHSYFALQGEGNGSVDHQIVKMNASQFALSDENRMVNGSISSVKGTPFDFITGKSVGDGIHNIDCEQIQYSDGYDHYFIFDDDKKHIVTVCDNTTKHTMIVESDLPGFHFFVPNYSNEIKGKNKHVYTGHCALCIETTFLPDAINSQINPETILRKNQKFHSETKYTFK